MKNWFSFFCFFLASNKAVGKMSCANKVPYLALSNRDYVCCFFCWHMITYPFISRTKRTMDAWYNQNLPKKSIGKAEIHAATIWPIWMVLARFYCLAPYYYTQYVEWKFAFNRISSSTSKVIQCYVSYNAFVFTFLLFFERCDSVHVRYLNELRKETPLENSQYNERKKPSKICFSKR